MLSRAALEPEPKRAKLEAPLDAAAADEVNSFAPTALKQHFDTEQAFWALSQDQILIGVIDPVDSVPKTANKSRDAVRKPAVNTTLLSRNVSAINSPWVKYISNNGNAKASLINSESQSYILAL